MLVYLYFIMVLANLYYCFYHKTNNFLLVFSAIILFIIIQGNTYNADYNGYLYFYNKGDYPASWEIGYTRLALFFKQYGLSYNNFLGMLLIPLFIFAYIHINAITHNWHPILLMFSLYSVFFATIQIRAFIIEIFFVGFLFYLSKNKVANFLFLYIIAIMFHNTAVVWGILLVCNPKYKKNEKYLIIFVMLILFCCLLVFLNGNSLQFLAIIAKNVFNIKEDKLIYFFTKGKLGFILAFICHFFNIAISKISNDYIQEGLLPEKYEVKRNFSQTTYLAVLISSFALPLVMINSNFIRFFRICLIPIFIQISIVIEMINENKVKSRKVLWFGKKVVFFNYAVYYYIVFCFMCSWIVLKLDFKDVFDILLNNMYLGNL